MNATDALNNLKADLDELEGRGTVRPGYIRAHREAHAVIRKELDTLRRQLEHERRRADALGSEAMDTMDRLLMMGTAMAILGHDPTPHLNRPLTDAPIYRKGLELLEQRMKEAGTYRMPWRGRWSWADRQQLLNGLLMEARLQLGLDKIMERIKHAKQA